MTKKTMPLRGYKQRMCEIARSFSYKHNLGDFSNVDFFCSQKAEVPIDQAEKTSELLYGFCKSEVIKSFNAFKKSKEPLAIDQVEAVNLGEIWKSEVLKEEVVVPIREPETWNDGDPNKIKEQ